jgi:diacylglycerol kinase (ATP)
VTEVALIANPVSGGSDSEALERVEVVLGSLGDVRLLQPSQKSFEQEVLHATKGRQLVIVAGGDGTLNHVVNALHGRLDDHVLGIIPMGTGNDLARTLGLRSDDPSRAAAAIVEGHSRAIDVGRATGPGVARLFLNACMGGFPVDVNVAIGAELKRRLGPAAFWVGGVKAAAQLERTTVWMNGAELEDCVAVGVGNGRTCGGGIELWPAAAPDDGILNGCALGAANRAAGLLLAARIKGGSHAQLDSVMTTQGRRIEITSEPDIEINVDGELVGLSTPAAFEVAGKVRIRF